MIDFSTLQGLTIPEGVVKEIKDANGVVLWRSISDTVVLEVAKITSDTYANETTYTGEEFILIEVTPESGGTVHVTYEGLTKTITDDGTAETPNSQQVFFGTFYGVSDEVATPASGTLKIEGNYTRFATTTYYAAKSTSNICGCVTAIKDFGKAISAGLSLMGQNSTVDTQYYHISGNVIVPGNVVNGVGFGMQVELESVVLKEGVTQIPIAAFTGCENLTSLKIPSSVTNVGEDAIIALYGSTFHNCKKLTNIYVDEGNSVYSSENGILFSKDKSALVAYPSATGAYTIPNSVTSIENFAFSGADLESVTIPNSVTSIGKYAFNGTDLESVTIPNSVTSIGGSAFNGTSSNFTLISLATTPPSNEDGTGVLGTVGSDDTISIVVPAGCGEAYKAVTCWSDYADYITEAS